MGRYKIIVLACIMVVGLTGCGKSNTVTSSPPEPSLDTGVADKIDPIVDIEPTPAATPEIEAPPVSVTYAEENDLNMDGIIDKSEWEAWVAAHPEDTNKDMQITSDELEVANGGNSGSSVQKPVETPPATTTPVTPPVEKPTETAKPVTPPATTTPKPVTPPATVETPKPVTPPATSGEKEAAGGLQGQTEAEIDQWLKENGLEDSKDPTEESMRDMGITSDENGWYLS